MTLTRKVRIKRCPLQEGVECPLGGPCVMGSGPEHTEFAIVGEAPAFQEVAQGLPFVGPSGRLLVRCLKGTGVSREDVYITNASKCRFPGNYKSPQKVAIARKCSVGLVGELQSRGVKYVLAMGNVAMAALGLAATGITRSRGTPIEHPSGLKVLPAVHPAATLRKGPTSGPSGIDTFIHDANLWRLGCISGTQPVFDNYDVIEKPSEAITFIKSLRAVEWAVVDLETSGYSLGYDEILCAVISRGPDDATVITSDALYDEDVCQALNEVRGVKWVGHNLSFDLLRLRRMLGVNWSGSFCTMLAHYCFTEEKGTHSLKQLATQLLGAPDWESSMKQYLKKPATDSFIFLPPPVLWKYCANDGVWNYRLFELFSEWFARPESAPMRKLFDTLMVPGINTIVELEDNGVFIDPARSQSLWADCRLQIDEAKGILGALARASLRPELGTLENPRLDDKQQAALSRLLARLDVGYNPNSVPQTRYILYERLGAPPYSRSDKGIVAQTQAPSGKADEYSTGKEQLERLTHWKEMPEVVTFVEALLAYRRPNHTISHYLKPFKEAVDTDGRIHPSYLLHGTVTGRLASRNPNVLNMTRDSGVRRCPAPEPGNILMSADYSQAELRALAMLSGDEVLKQIYREGGDVHNTVAEWFYGKFYSIMQRVITKGFVFGWLYGRGIASISAGFGISAEEARQKVEILARMAPGLPAFIQEVRRSVLTRGYFETPLGRRRRFPLATAANWGAVQRYAVNAPIQGTSSDILFIAMTYMCEWARDMGVRLLFPLHDSCNAEVPLDGLHRVVIRVVYDMLRAPIAVFGPDCIPFEVDVKVGPSLQEEMRDGSGVVTIEGDLKTYEYDMEEVHEYANSISRPLDYR